jgi:hypothetical protein
MHVILLQTFTVHLVFSNWNPLGRALHTLINVRLRLALTIANWVQSCKLCYVGMYLYISEVKGYLSLPTMWQMRLTLSPSMLTYKRCNILDNLLSLQLDLSFVVFDRLYLCMSFICWFGQKLGSLLVMLHIGSI